MDYVTKVFRWIHILTAAAWLGEVVVINFVLLPVLFRLAPAERGRFLKQIFPRLFRLASYLTFTILIAGAVLAMLRTQGNLSLLVTTRWGQAILAGGVPGLLLILFHFFLEERFEHPVSTAEDEPHGQDAERVYRRLRVVPRIGLGLIIFIILAMMVAAHGGLW